MDKKLEEAGLHLRRRMFGSAGAEDALNNATAFRRRFEEIVTEQCFGEAWNQPPLDHRIRSMLTIAILATLGRSPQLRYHVQGAIANGVSKEEIRETLMQVWLYAGIPAAAEGFNVAGAVLKEAGLD
ncbi:MAG: carboxymuconolactone decarboxylase family protein [Steroidobacteraceae bacterium]